MKNIFENDESFLKQFIADNEIYLKNKIKYINHLFKINKNDDEKIWFALDLFNEIFIDEPRNLLIENPLDKKNEDSTPYWSDLRRPPKQLNFDINKKEYFYGFISSVTNILDFILGYKIDEEKNKEKIQQFFMKNNEEKIKEFLTNEKINFNDIINNNISNKFLLNIPEFNKEDILGHINFIHNCSNLRAISYSIPECDFNKTFKYVGKIAPSSINSLATISGYMTLCMIAIIHNKMVKNMKINKEKIKFKSYTLDFTDNCYFVRPLPSLIYKEDTSNDPFFKCPILAIPNKFHSWEKITINKSMTIKELIDYLKDKYEVDVSLIQAENISSIFLKNYRKNELLKKNLETKIEDAYAKSQKLDKIIDRYLFLKISGTKNETKIVMPLIKYFFRENS